MSGEREAAEGADEGFDEGVEDTGLETGEDQGGEGEEEGEAKPSTDWEKRAHNHAGQAAREKSRRRAAEARAQELEGRLAQLERRFGGEATEDELLALIGSLPDNEDDPVGDIAAVKRALRIYRQREMSAGQQNQQQAAFEREVNKLRSSMTESEEDFATEHPDYYEAAKHYRQSRVDELREAGYSGRHLEQKLADDLFGVVRFAMESGQDPAERVYALAGRRGFRPGTKAANANLDKLASAANTGVRAVARQGGSVMTMGDVAKLDGAAREKAYAKLRARELARDKTHRG
jgi:hypothetical protein